ncbi:MAG TPA: cysteine hydrolase family protein [Candidatus Obscuribacter sp.]|nr:cysteine hydrolase [Candidatus Obscuribacter sp.]MBK9277823.1 cysteine hydrolase [Candidatus Obscuribacter sp.]MBL8085486.1 cysteine hydrolase [Candidatus Obscuribacter sp.]HMW90587.1 cysteine hydrolase family protein [Candidatus Obscuribacter sp.]HMX44500.1 cysteine hydrolase family protein [Candidatus Obscuribacter sp.]
MAQTLLQMLNAEQKPSRLSKSALIIVDAQREYQDGAVPLTGFEKAVGEISALLERARKLETKVWHIRHKTFDGAPIFAPDGKYFQIVDALTPAAGEAIVDKQQPSSFAGTDLHEQLQKAGIKDLIVTGFMTHACISTTVRSAHSLGYPVTLVGSACATRDLPDINGGLVKAAELHNATLAALKDLFATLVTSTKEIED